MSIVFEGTNPAPGETEGGVSDKSFQPPRLFERDIDILLAEEFQVSPDFASYFLSELELKDFVEGTVVGIHVSKIGASGESDLVVIFKKPDSVDRFAIFIEDKINAPLQPEQLMRYRERAEAGRRDGYYQGFAIVLLAPEAYIAACHHSHEFDAKISYESIAKFLKTMEPGSRNSYRAAAVLEAAKRGGIAPPSKEFDEDTSKFWSEVYKMALKEFHLLEMKPITRPAKGQSWVQFQTVAMTKRPVFVSLVLKGDKGIADLAFAGVEYEKLHPQVSQLLDKDMTIAKSGESTLVIRMKSPPFRTTPFDKAALSNCRAGLEVCVSLILFYEKNKGVLDLAASQSLAPTKPVAY